MYKDAFQRNPSVIVTLLLCFSKRSLLLLAEHINQWPSAKNKVQTCCLLQTIKFLLLFFFLLMQRCGVLETYFEAIHHRIKTQKAWCKQEDVFWGRPLQVSLSKAKCDTTELVTVDSDTVGLINSSGMKTKTETHTVLEIFSELEIQRQISFIRGYLFCVSVVTKKKEKKSIVLLFIHLFIQYLMFIYVLLIISLVSIPLVCIFTFLQFIILLCRDQN